MVEDAVEDAVPVVVVEVVVVVADNNAVDVEVVAAVAAEVAGEEEEETAVIGQNRPTPLGARLGRRGSAVWNLMVGPTLASGELSHLLLSALRRSRRQRERLQVLLRHSADGEERINPKGDDT